MKKIVIFASGNGSNAAAIIRHFQDHPNVKVVAVYCNNPAAGVIQKAQDSDVPVRLFNREMLNGGMVLQDLEKDAPDLIVLAGFLWLFPASIVARFPRQIVNIHPALLPKYGGKGMYGMNVHRAVQQNGEKSTGITVHFVDEHYDEGDVIFQASVALDGRETCEEIAGLVQDLEHKHFPTVIEQLLLPDKISSHNP